MLRTSPPAPTASAAWITPVFDLLQDHLRKVIFSKKE
jgi:hypothetical protein